MSVVVVVVSSLGSVGGTPRSCLCLYSMAASRMVARTPVAAVLSKRMMIFFREVLL